MGYALAFSRRAAAAVLVAAALSACSSSSTGTGERAFVRQAETLINGTLRHRVDVTVLGDTASIRAVVQNVGAAPVDVSSRICGLDVDPALPWAYSVTCGAVSMFAPLAPGDSLVATDRRLIDRAGLASIRVRHLLLPDTWVTVTLR